MHVLEKHREVEEENSLTLFLMLWQMFFLMNQLRNSCKLITNLEPSHHYAAFNFLNTLRQYNPSNKLFSYFKALTVMGNLLPTTNSKTFSISYYIIGFYCLK